MNQISKYFVATGFKKKKKECVSRNTPRTAIT